MEQEPIFNREILKKLSETNIDLSPSQIFKLSDYLTSWIIKYIEFFKEYQSTDVYMATVNLFPKNNNFKLYTVISVIDLYDITSDALQIEPDQMEYLISYIMNSVSIDTITIKKICYKNKIKAKSFIDYIVLSRVVDAICDCILNIIHRMKINEIKLVDGSDIIDEAIEVFKILIM